jgi:hypothetical protein
MAVLVVLFGAYLIVQTGDGWVLAYKYIEKIRRWEGKTECRCPLLTLYTRRDDRIYGTRVYFVRLVSMANYRHPQNIAARSQAHKAHHVAAFHHKRKISNTPATYEWSADVGIGALAGGDHCA